MAPIDHTLEMNCGQALREDYQRFLLLGGRRAPLTLYVHERGYRSDIINTDALGLRYSHLGGKRYSLAERGGSARVNLLVGGSTALGIGASSDQQTVASCLALLTGEVWLSLAGCGLDATQELLLFLSHQPRLGRIGHVVILSGLNTLAHEGMCEMLADDQQANMRVDAPEHRTSDAQPQQATTHRPPWPHWLQRLFRRRQQPLPPPVLSSPEKRLIRAADRIGRTLLQWDRLLADSHTSLTFILQPLLPWCREKLPPGEQAMLKLLLQRSDHYDRLLDGVYDDHLHSIFFRRIKSQAEPVPCYDMNGMLSSSPVFGQDLFIDRLHLNDLGNNALAKVITAKLGLAQEKYASRKASPFKLV
ncbi:hypothetical protein ACK2SD_13265 [Pseudomonas sp. SC11]|uniref:hypothetical protein n=1 Tax=Pseudomonas sp. SC11 TaxID=326927 RepID=UPI00399B374C